MSGRCRVRQGARAGEHGLATPHGSISHTGIGGLTLGGGVGWLSPMLGLACENVVASDVVTADGELRYASADEYPDPYWAVRGGGDNVGTTGAIDVVTDMLPRKSSPLSFTPSFPLYGSYGERLEETAWAGTGSEHLILDVAAPHAGSDRTYINFMGEKDDERVRASFGPKYARLASIKAEYDPDNVFHRNPNIRPAS